MLSHTESNDRETDRNHDWRHEAIRKVEADANRSAHTHLHVYFARLLDLPFHRNSGREMGMTRAEASESAGRPGRHHRP